MPLLSEISEFVVFCPATSINVIKIAITDKTIDIAVPANDRITMRLRFYKE